MTLEEWSSIFDLWASSWDSLDLRDQPMLPVVFELPISSKNLGQGNSDSRLALKNIRFSRLESDGDASAAALGAG